MKLSKWIMVCLMCLWTGYQGPKEDPIEIWAVSVHEESLKPMYHIDEFDCSEILMELLKSNGETEIIPLDPSMIEPIDQPKLLNAGSHLLNVDVEGLDTVVPINLYQNEYDFQLLSLYIHGIHDAIIQDLSYTEWLESIEGAPGISVSDASINEEGHLIITLSDGTSHDAGVVQGEDGLDGLNGAPGSNIELSTEDGMIQWRIEGAEWTPLVALTDLRGSRGFTGAKGADGVGITDTTVSETGGLIIHYSDGTHEEIELLKQEYMVLFKDAKGSIIDVQTIKKGDPVVPPTPPSLEGHTFITWSETIEAIEAHAVITPVYEKRMMSVTFDSGGGSQVASQEVPYGATMDLETPTKDAHRFEGWYVSESPQAMRFTDQSPVTGDITLYAKWSKPVYTVVFKDIEDTSLQMTHAHHGQSVTPPEVPLVTGHTFTEWSTSSASITSDLIIEPIYEPNTYTVTYHLLENYEVGDELALNHGETISEVAVGGAHSGLITSEGRLFMWGDNQSHQLGLSNQGLIAEPTYVNDALNLLEVETIVSMALGSAHTVLLTSLGNVYTFGANPFGQLGTGTTQSALTAQAIDLSFLAPGDKVIAVESGGNHTGLLTALGYVYLFGSNALNQISLSDTPYYPSPERMALQFEVARDDKVISLDMGDAHNAVFTEQGEVILWGNSEDHQIGYYNSYDFYKPYIVLNDNEVYEGVILGANHTALLTNQRLFMWGGNESGQLGINSTQDQSRPQAIPIDVSTIDTIELGSQVSFITTKDDRILASGSTSNHRILTDALSDILSFTDVTTYYESIGWNAEASLTLGQSTSSAHGLIALYDRVIGWGTNDTHQLGTPDPSVDSHFIGTYQMMTLYSEDAIYQSPDPLWVYSTESGQTITKWYTDLALTQVFQKESMQAADTHLYGIIE